jgi:sugar/nucleoside kinase (ribokinase family)
LTVSLDTNDDPSDLWRGVLDLILDKVNILLPNEDELLKIAKAIAIDEALDRLAPRIPLIVVKCGSRGALVQVGTQRQWVSPIVVEPVDTIGAGDSFNAGFLNAWLGGADPLSAAAAGNLAGALSTLRPGGVEAYRDRELRTQFLAGHPLR